MSVRVRYAPSPTGRLHIGGARTALYSYLYARAQGGTFILRIEDTDTKRGDKKYEKSQIDDLAWLGMHPDEGPYRQSERLDSYRDTADKLMKEGKAYPCFLTQDELDNLTKKAVAENKAPHTYHNYFANLDPQEALERINLGGKYVVRFRNLGKKNWSIDDHVRGKVVWEGDSVGDFVIMRSNNFPVYNFCCVVDDILMGITHVIRADDHLNNTLRQLMLYDAIGKKPPDFAHCSLIVGKDRQKLSKRQDAMSVAEYRERHYLPKALANYIYLLGRSHSNEQEIFDVYALGKNFSLSEFSKSPATYDTTKLDNFNGRHMRMLGAKELVDYVSRTFSDIKDFSLQDQTWKEKTCRFFASRVNLPSEMIPYVKSIFENTSEDSEELKTILSSELGRKIRGHFAEKLSRIQQSFVDESQVEAWINDCKNIFGVKGKSLFMVIRAVLTRQTEGADLKTLISLIPVKSLKARLAFKAN